VKFALLSLTYKQDFFFPQLSKKSFAFSKPVKRALLSPTGNILA
jgi:hypothetical protein